MRTATSIFFLVAMLIVGVVQLRLGYLGIEYHLGTITAAFAVLAMFLGFLLPLTIGSYFGAVDVMNWPVWAGLLLAAPGLLFITPMIVLEVVKSALAVLNGPEVHKEPPSTSQPKASEDIKESKTPFTQMENKLPPRATDAEIDTKFNDLIRYSRVLRDLHASISELPDEFRWEWRCRVVQSNSPLEHAEEVRDELVARYEKVLNPFDSDEANFYYTECRKKLGNDAAQRYANALSMLGSSADPRETFEVVLAEEREAQRKKQLELKEEEARTKWTIYTVVAVILILLGLGIAFPQIFQSQRGVDKGSITPNRPSAVDANGTTSVPSSGVGTVGDKSVSENLDTGNSGGSQIAIVQVPQTADSPDLAAAFFAATGHRTSYSTEVAPGISGGQPATVTTKPERLLELQHSTVLLTTTNIADACHACAGYLGIYYLERKGDEFSLKGSWPEAVPGSGWGAPPEKWDITKKLTNWPAVYAENGYGNQGTFNRSALIVELTPSGPMLSDEIDIGYDNSGYDLDSTNNTSVKGRISNIVKGRSFEVHFSGTCKYLDGYVFQGGRFVRSAPRAAERCL